MTLRFKMKVKHGDDYVDVVSKQRQPNSNRNIQFILRSTRII